MKIITKQLADKLPGDHDLLNNKVVNPKDYLKICSILTKVKQLVIYDLTITLKHPPDTIISVGDHINRTGKNPLIESKKWVDINFIDITKLYNTKQNSVETNCCGNKLNGKYPYPSHFLCNISIIAKAHEIKKISAFLVNIP